MSYENMYEELYEILSYMDKSTVMKIPEDILNQIIKKRNKSFKTKINKNDLFNENNISREAMDVLCWFDYNYWADPNRKKEIKGLRKEYLIKEEEEKRRKYNPDDIFREQLEIKDTFNNTDNSYVDENSSNLKKAKGILKRIFG